jgi:hypothetical protein
MLIWSWIENGIPLWAWIIWAIAIVFVWVLACQKNR